MNFTSLLYFLVNELEKERFFWNVFFLFFLLFPDSSTHLDLGEAEVDSQWEIIGAW